ncbi:YnfC family lipoprotein [Klebsiella indica]|uniref:UPF0257 lipoprotein FE839_18070 n=2 Tax=Klebsiella/Raoultella group TaxID=2890311 RepID=A0A5R9LDK7_9ENTR|nr:YnfC family lipoprotein [Klebsiella indica]TLV11500.1 YnfC family lipoprotein [Klebsiella indica]
MKIRFFLLMAIWALSGCDEKAPPQAFTPEMASFSNEFEFDPLRGPVKAFSQKLYNQHDEEVKWVKGRLSREGCFDLLAFQDRENRTGAVLVLDANYYLDAQSHEKRLRLQGKCQLAEMPSAGVLWETDDNGFVATARAGASVTTYRYDSEGYPLGKTTVANDDRLTVSSTPSADPRKKLDYTAVSIFNHRTLGHVSQSCDYDSHDNPVSCELQVIDDSVQPSVTRRYTIKNSIEYY